MTEDDAQAWLLLHQIAAAVKPSTFDDEPGWRFTLTRADKSVLKLAVPEKSLTSLLHFIAREAWEKYPARKSGALAESIRSFFFLDELRELYSESLEDPTNR